MNSDFFFFFPPSLFMCICSATDFTLKPSDCPDTEFPVRIADSERGCLWYKKDNKFKIPKGEICGSVCLFACSVSSYLHTGCFHKDFGII